MKSKISFFNFGLLRKNAVRFSPIWIGYFICWAVAMPVTLTMRLMEEDAMLVSLDVAEYVGTLLDGGMIVTFVYGIIVAMAVWSYLYSSRSVALMHALPIRRSGLFLTNYVSGLLFIIVPHLVVALLTLLVTAMASAAAPGMILSWFWAMCAAGVFFYSFATFIAMFTGHILALPVFYVIYNFLVFVLYYMIEAFTAPFLYGLTGVGLGGEKFVEWLTPVVNLSGRVFTDSVYEEATEADGIIRYAGLQEVTLNGMELLPVYAAAGIVLAVLAYVVYRTHRSETAGDVVCVEWAKVVFRYGVALTAAFTIGQGMYQLLFSHGGSVNVVAELICMILVAVIGFAIALMLLNKTFHVIKKSVRGSAICTVVLLVIFAVANFDVFGTTKYVPDVENIKSVAVDVSAYGYSNAVLREPENIEKTVDLHRYLIEHRTEIEEAHDDWRWSRGEAINTDITLCYTMKDGSTTVRYYHVMVEKTDFDDENTISSKVKDIVDTKEYLASNLLGDMLEAENAPRGALFTYYGENDPDAMYERKISAEDTQVLYQAVLEDIHAGRIRDINLLDEPAMKGYENEVRFISKPQGEKNTQELIREVYLTKEMTSTIAALEKLGILNDHVKLSYRETEAADAMMSHVIEPETEEVVSTTADVAAVAEYSNVTATPLFSTEVEAF